MDDTVVFTLVEKKLEYLDTCIVYEVAPGTEPQLKVGLRLLRWLVLPGDVSVGASTDIENDLADDHEEYPIYELYALTRHMYALFLRSGSIGVKLFTLELYFIGFVKELSDFNAI